MEGPATIDDLVRDAASAGHQVTRRMIRDWCERGLLDRPRRRPRGRGKGSAPALYDRHQRQLFITILNKRSEMSKVPALAQIPFFLWAHFGEPYITTRQATIAFTTWLDDPRASRQQARRLAAEMTHGLVADDASKGTARRLERVLEDIAYTGQLDEEQLMDAVRASFQPSSLSVERAVGPPQAPLTATAVVDVLRLRILAADTVSQGALTADQMDQARFRYRTTMSEYFGDAIDWRPFETTHPLSRRPDSTIQAIFDTCARDFLLALGTVIANP